MGFDLYIIYTTTFNKATGQPFNPAPPAIPHEHHWMLSLKGYGWSQFIAHCEGDRVTTLGFADDLPEWADVADKADLDEEEYADWKKAMEWFNDKDNFYLAWGY